MLRQLKRPILLAVLLSACGAEEASHVPSDAVDEEIASIIYSPQGAWQPSLPTNTSDVQVVETVRFLFCSFSIGTAVQAPPFPPLYLVWLRRESVSSWLSCSPGYVVLGSSYALPSVDLARHPYLPLLVTSFSTKQTPSGSAHWALSIVQPSYATGNVVRRSMLAAMSPSPFEPQLGNVYNGTLSVELDGTLNVDGDKDGLMTPTETPPGDLHYSARYIRFFFNPSTQPVPDEIETF